MGGKNIGNHPGKRLQRGAENLVITPAEPRLARAAASCAQARDHSGFEAAPRPPAASIC